MPYLKIQTNLEPDRGHCDALLKAASAAIAEALGKPERYVMVALESGTPMAFAGSADPSAYLELKSIGLPESRTGELSATLCGLINRELDIPADRIYIEFADAQRHLWGWNAGTF